MLDPIATFLRHKTSSLFRYLGWTLPCTLLGFHLRESIFLTKYLTHRLDRAELLYVARIGIALARWTRMKMPWVCSSQHWKRPERIFTFLERVHYLRVVWNQLAECTKISIHWSPALCTKYSQRSTPHCHVATNCMCSSCASHRHIRSNEQDGCQLKDEITHQTEFGQECVDRMVLTTC